MPRAGPPRMDIVMVNAPTAVAPAAVVRTARQQPTWHPDTGLDAVIAQLRARPALVTASSCYSLQRDLALVAAGAALVMQAGDCAERFADATAERIAARVDLLAKLADLVEEATGRPVVRIGRLAGQYGKPRSQDLEQTADGQLLPAYRGDAVNAPEEDRRGQSVRRAAAAGRVRPLRPDPRRAVPDRPAAALRRPGHPVLGDLRQPRGAAAGLRRSAGARRRPPRRPVRLLRALRLDRRAHPGRRRRARRARPGGSATRSASRSGRTRPVPRWRR